MRQKITITLEEEILTLIKQLAKDEGRSFSHQLERYAIAQLKQEGKIDDDK